MNNQTTTASMSIDEQEKVMGGLEIGPRRPKFPIPIGTPPYNPLPPITIGTIIWFI